METLETLEIDTEIKFTASMGIMIGEKEILPYKGVKLTLDNINLLLKEGKGKGWKIREKTQMRFNSMLQINIEIDDFFIANVFMKKYWNAKDRNIEFSLSLKNIKTLYNRKTCYYTGERLIFNDARMSPTLDRIDNKKGYTKDNTVLCSFYINNLKNLLFENPEGIQRIEMKHLLKLIKKTTCTE